MEIIQNFGTTAIKFSQNNIIEGTAISHTEGSDEILINQTGIYQVSYSYMEFKVCQEHLILMLYYQ